MSKSFTYIITFLYVFSGFVLVWNTFLCSTHFSVCTLTTLLGVLLLLVGISIIKSQKKFFWYIAYISVCSLFFVGFLLGFRWQKVGRDFTPHIEILPETLTDLMLVLAIVFGLYALLGLGVINLFLLIKLWGYNRIAQVPNRRIFQLTAALLFFWIVVGWSFYFGPLADWQRKAEMQREYEKKYSDEVIINDEWVKLDMGSFTLEYPHKVYSDDRKHTWEWKTDNVFKCGLCNPSLWLKRYSSGSGGLLSVFFSMVSYHSANIPVGAVPKDALCQALFFDSGSRDDLCTRLFNHETVDWQYTFEDQTFHYPLQYKKEDINIDNRIGYVIHREGGPQLWGPDEWGLTDYPSFLGKIDEIYVFDPPGNRFLYIEIQDKYFRNVISDILNTVRFQ